jgi:hypothetical protein
MNIKKMLTRLAFVGAAATLMAGCCVLPYGPRGHYSDNHHGGWGQRR